MVLENQVGRRIDFSDIGPRRAQGMLQQVQRLIHEHRSSPAFHSSQQDPAYLQLVIMEQALTARVQEQAMAGTGPVPTGTQAAAATNDPKARAVMDKVKRKQPLTPDEQQTVNRIALAKESKHPQRMVREQNELQQAQVVLAAQDMIDRIQGMLEDISEMQFKDLPALAASIKNDMGVEKSQQFQTSASAALTQLLTAVQSGKTELESAQSVLTGQAPVVPGGELGAAAGAMPGADMAADADVDADVDALDDIAADAADDLEEPATGAALGRERR
jgi:hypothetical protein